MRTWRAGKKGLGKEGGLQEPLLEMGMSTMSGGNEDEAFRLPGDAASPSKPLSEESRIQQLDFAFVISFFKSYINVLINNNGPVTASTIPKGSKIRFGICNYDC